jgi:hypothetical protein
MAPHKKKKKSSVSQEQRNKKGFLMKLQKHCGEQGFWRRRRPFPSYERLMPKGTGLFGHQSEIVHDYLSIMASSVSSEHVFSQGGITISKRRIRLSGDIVEAIQCVKCSIRHDLIFRKPPSLVEDEFQTDEEPGDDEKPDDDVEEDGWDDLFFDEDDDGSGSDDETW